MRLLERQFRANDWLIERAVAGFTAADWAFTHGASNPAAWIVGHLAGARRDAARAAGVSIAREPWEAAYGFGSRRDVPPAVLLAPEAALAALAAAGDALYARLRILTPEQAAEPIDDATPDGRTDRLSVLGHLACHEAYHAGQLGLIRRQRGMPRIV